MATFFEYLLGPEGLLPKWLRRKWGRRYFSAIAYELDAYPKVAREAVLARHPTYAPLDALPVHADERKLEQLPGESSTSFRARLRGAFPAYRQAGSGRGLQNRLREAGFTTATKLEANDFAPVAGQTWARFWVVIFDPTLVDRTFAWGDGTKWGAGTWGGPNIVARQTVQKLIRKWKAPYEHLEAAVFVASGRPWGTFKWGDGTTWGSKSARFGI